MKYLFLLILLLFVSLTPVEARSGCCSSHGGVCGCRCCDGTPLSAKCAPYYPSCNDNGEVLPAQTEQSTYIQPTQRPSSTPKPTKTPIPTRTPIPTITPTPTITPIITETPIPNPTTEPTITQSIPTPTPKVRTEGFNFFRWLFGLLFGKR